MDNDKPKEIKCFVIMPFSETEHTVNGETIKIVADEWGYIFDKWIKKAVEAYPNATIKCKRSAAAPGNFIKGIITDLYDSRIVIADLTGQKPNVYYELGIRHALSLGTVMITQDFKHLPSDLQSYYCFKYEYSKEAYKYDSYYKEFEKHLHEKIEHILANTTSDNPVSDFLDLKHYYQLQKLDNEKKKLLNHLDGLEFFLNDSYGILSNRVSKKVEYLENKTFPFIFLDFDFFTNLSFSILSAEYYEIPQKLLNPISNLLYILRKEFRSVYQFWEGSRNHINPNNLEKLFDHCNAILLNKRIRIKELKRIIVEIDNYQKQDTPAKEHPAL